MNDSDAVEYIMYNDPTIFEEIVIRLTVLIAALASIFMITHLVLTYVNYFRGS